MFPRGDNNKAKQPHVPQQSTSQQPASTPAVTSQPASSTPEQAQTSAEHRNILSSDVEINGSVNFSDELVVDGKIEGEINSTGLLFIQENARIKAEVKVGSTVIVGKVHGNIIASETVELKTGAEVVGDIKAKVLAMESGAIFVGRSEIGKPTSAPQKQSSSKPKSSGGNQQKKSGQPKQQPNQKAGQAQKPGPTKPVAKAS